MTVTEPHARERSSAAEFVEFFAEGWAKGAGDDFFAHFESRIHPDVFMTQPLAPPARGIATFRPLFEPVFRAMPDLRGDVRSWGETKDGVMIELRLSGHFGGRPVAWTTVDRIVLEDGKIKERHAHFDPAPLLKAMLLRPQVTLPLLPVLLRGRRRG
ncbi:MAG TPA: ester cyclase [Solirubrobacterales bacterium]|nr:ester cyclase [Solirubrobacterales bacterium]